MAPRRTGAIQDTEFYRYLLDIEPSWTVKRVKFPKEDLDDVYWGVVMVRSDENGLARCAALQAGIPDYVSAVHVNRACCSSMEAIHGGYGFIGDYDIERFYRAAKILGIYEGTKEIEKMTIGRQIVGPA